MSMSSMLVGANDFQNVTSSFRLLLCVAVDQVQWWIQIKVYLCEGFVAGRRKMD